MSNELTYALLEQKYGKDGADELTRLQSEVERLAKFVRAGDRLCYELESWLAAEHDKESQRAINIWKRLRQQAPESAGGEG